MALGRSIPSISFNHFDAGRVQSAMTLARHWAPSAGARLLLIFLALAPGRGWAADPKPGPPLTIRRVTAPITVDGDLSDPGWQGIEGITTWYETHVGDNVEPQVKNVAYLAYDDT